MSITTQSTRLGSLCTGYGGLDLAAEEFLGARTIWCAEFEEAPSRVIEARFPGVPNMHDVKRIPWWIMAPIDALTAGYPCQPFSLAGARKGEEDPRHLWPSIAEGIRIMRPRHVLLENVRGHLSLGFDQVLHDLNGLGYAVAWRILSASAVGACHRRERLFIYAQPVEFVAEQHGPVLAVAGADGWLEAEADLFGERMTYAEQLPPAGTMRGGEIRAVTLHQPPLNLVLFPTPNAMVSNDGEGPETWLARRERSKRPDHGGNGMPLTIAVQLLPTPTTQDSAASGGSNASNVTLTDAVVRTELGTRENPRLLPTPITAPTTGNGHARSLGGELKLLPTPDAYQGSRGGSQDPEKRRAGGHTVSLADVVEKGSELLPTPRSSRDASSTEIAYALGAKRSDEGRTQGEVVFTNDVSWGKYEAAIARHAAQLGRPPAAPTQENARGNPELAPAFVEWMMCLPAGWVTEAPLAEGRTPRGVREAVLKMLGNGVVPPQALAAFGSLAAITAVHEAAA